MSGVLHIPALRRGRPYESLDKIEVKDYRTGEVKALVSQVNAGILRKDLPRMIESRAALKRLTITQLFEICVRAGDQFVNASLPLAEQTQSPQQYIETLSATSGLPYAMVRRNMAKIHDA